MNKIGILGSGIVGQTLANGLHDVGYEVRIGSRNGSRVENWGGDTGTFSEVTVWADTVILAVKGTVAEDVVRSIAEELADKTVIDTTNPISNDPPDNGVLHYFTTFDESLMEHLQKIATKANFVKAFNSVGNGAMVQPQYEAGLPTMFICGNNADAKQQTVGILTKLGWETYDMGGVKAARAIEPLCMLWCIPGFRDNSWNHAFKLLKK